MKFLEAFFMAASLPLMLLNFFGAIVAAIWLLIIGDWRLVLYGICVAIVSIFILSLALMPQFLFAMPMAWCMERKKRIATILCAVPAGIWGFIVVTLWCLSVYSVAMQNIHGGNTIPLLLWSYGLATGPFLYMMNKEDQGDGESKMGTLLPNFAAEVGYVALIVATLFGVTSFWTALTIFSVPMVLAFLWLLLGTVLMAFTLDDEPQLDFTTYDFDDYDS